MAQDRSRSAFDVRTPKHWSSLQAQQGRLLSDDDWNEADAISQDDTRHTRVHVIGPAGSPDDGFKLANPRVTAGGVDFDLSPGTYYVGGLRATLEQAEPYSLQRDWLQQPASERPAPGNAERIDLAYLEVWQQPVTAVEDGELQEVALGGPDTSVRIRTMRRVHLRTNVGTESCATAWAGLVGSLGGLGSDNELASDATLAVGNVPNSGPGTDLCSPAVQLGYLGAENQAIRVEIGTGNTFLWGFDNASPLYRVQVTTDLVTGAQVIHFLSTPKDEAHWPLAQQIVELLPWSAVLPNGEKVAETSAGFLTRVSASYDPNTQNIQVTPTVTSGFGTTWLSRSDAGSLGNVSTAFFYLRVWNRGADTASPPEIPFTPGVAVPLTGTGLQVTLGGTHFRRGDFWIIAARPSPAKVVPWSLETGRIAEGVRRFYAPLGLIHWRPGGVPTAFDCRVTFDPLTRPRGCCVTVAPRSGWEHTVDEVADADDLCLCFQPGDYTTTRTLVLRNKNVKVHGAGAASRIHGSGIEAVLRFEGCQHVEIRDLAVDASATLREGKAAPRPHLSGAITTSNCDHVAISGVIARSASGPVKNASCIAIYSALPAGRVLASSARVTGCELIVGANQVGLSVINYGHTTISDNVVHVDPVENTALPAWWLQDLGFRRSFRRTLIYRYGLVNDEGHPVPVDAIRMSLGQTPIWIETANQVAKSWPAVAASRKFHPRRIDHMTVGEFLDELAADLIWSSGGIGKRRFPDFERYIADMLALRTQATAVRTLAAQGIVVAGGAAHDVRITGNLVRDTPQGIHVATSTRRVRNPGPGAPVFDTAGRVVISNNSVYVTLMPESVVERHGIFIGNCKSLVIEDNHLECEKLGAASRLHIDGIRCYGLLGRMAYITRNDMIAFNTGIRIAPLNNATKGRPSSMWRVVENIASGSDPIVDRRLGTGIATNVVDGGNQG